MFICCELCLQERAYNTSVAVDDTILEILEILCITTKIVPGPDKRICLTCKDNVYSLFNFKSNCILTEDLLCGYYKTNNKQICLHNVLLKAEEEDQCQNKELQICRLCLNKINKSVGMFDVISNNSNHSILRKYFPELKLDAVRDGYICYTCVIDLKRFSEFTDFITQSQETFKQENAHFKEKVDIKLEHQIQLDDVNKEGIEIAEFIIKDDDNDDYNDGSADDDNDGSADDDNDGSADDDNEGSDDNVNSEDSEEDDVKNEDIYNEVIEDYEDISVIEDDDGDDNNIYDHDVNNDFNDNDIKDEGDNNDHDTNNDDNDVKDDDNDVKDDDNDVKGDDNDVKGDDNDVKGDDNDKDVKEHKEEENIDDVFCETEGSGCQTFSSNETDSSKPELHSEELSYSCRLCSYETKSKLNLNVHHRKRHSNKTYLRSTKVNINKIANNFFKFCAENNENNTPHLKSEGKDENWPFSCELCSYRGSTKGNLAQHKRRCHSSKIFSCELCSYETRNCDCWYKHQKKHLKKNKSYSGMLGKYKTKSKAILNRHKFKEHKNKTNTSELKAEKTNSSKKISKIIQHESKNRLLPKRISSQVRNSITITGDKHKIFSCPLCSYKGACKDHLNKHTKRLHSNKILSCLLCSYQTTKSDDFYQHRKKYHNMKGMSYKVKNKIKWTQQRLTFHTTKNGTKKEKKKKTTSGLKESKPKVHQNDKIEKVFCKLCDYVSVSLANLKQHIYKLHNDKILTCEYCSYETTKPDSMYRHQKNHHSNKKKKYLCTLCPYKGRSKEYLNKHKFRCHNNNDTKDDSKNSKQITTTTSNMPFSCKLCSYKGGSKVNLRQHVYLVHNNKIVSCPLCPFTTHNRGSLYQHRKNCRVKGTKLKKMFNGIKKKLNCTKSTNKIKSMGHSVNETYNCNLCSYSTKHKGNLKKHQNVHSISKMFACELCPYKGSSKENLNKHKFRCHNNNKTKDDTKDSKEITTTSSNMAFFCELCSYKGGSELNLKQHTYRSHNDKIWSCPSCPFETHNNDHMYQHRKKYHMKGTKLKKMFNGIKKKFNSAKSSKIKSRRHSANETYNCNLCSYNTKHKGNLRKHQNVHSQETSNGDISQIFSCELCLYTTKYKGHLKRHLGTLAHKSKESSLGKTASNEELNEPQDEHSQETSNGDVSNVLCELCPSKMTFKGNLNQHLATHTHESNESSLGKTASNEELNEPQDAHSQETSNGDVSNVLCELCPSKTTFKGNLNQHLATHTDESNESSLGITASNEELNEPQDTHSQETSNGDVSNVLLCKLCPYETTFKGNLNQHLATHTDESNESSLGITASNEELNEPQDAHSKETSNDDVSNEFSPYKTRFQGNLYRYLATNTYESDESNLETMADNEMVNQPQAAHSKETSNSDVSDVLLCELSPYKTRFKGNLKRHLATHTHDSNESSLGKTACNEELNEPQDAHSKETNNGDVSKIFLCELCKYKTKYKGHLKRHLGTHSRKSNESNLEKTTDNEKLNNNKPQVQRDITKENSKESLDSHFAVDNKTYSCELGQNLTTIHLKVSPKTSESVEESVNNDGILFCKLCKYKSYFKAHLKHHIYRIHNDKVLYCPFCSFETKKRDSLYRHRKDNHSHR